MNTETFFFTEHLDINTEQLSPANLNSEELKIIKYCIEITRHIQEIDCLFQIFRFNLKNMLHHYTLFTSDKIKRNVEYAIATNDSIAINALVISFISAGKTMIESIESFLKINSMECYQDFRDNYLTAKYDKHFHYRLLLRLRDYAQHGHLPVSINFDNKYCFDLNHILSDPHFNHNSTLKNQMENIRNEIIETYTDYPYIALTLSLAEFNVCVTEIYLAFLKKTRAILHSAADNVNLLLDKRPEIINKSSDYLDGHVFYEIIDDTLHSFNSKDNPKKMLAQFKNLVSEILKEEQSELDKIRLGFKFN